MPEQNKTNPSQPKPLPGNNANHQRQQNQEKQQQAEQNEVAGRHKNDGQKDHKGAR